MREPVVSFRANQGLLAAIVDRATREGRTRSDVIRDALREKVGVQ